jgi:MFS transporter, ACS family, tartrate transporter
VIAAPMSPLYRKIAWRLVPFLVLLYMVAFLDRVNISFAALTMNRDMGISESLYGFAAGIFFLGYCLFEVPANMMLARLGARRWIAILLVGWGIVSVATAFVANRPQYVAARFLLGVAESGFFPGVIFYLTIWLPRPMRARVLALFIVAVPLCTFIGSPISSHILLMNNVGGLKGWQWLFVLEGAPALILGIATWFVLADNPLSAPWLSGSEKEQLAQELHSDEQSLTDSSLSGAWLHVTRASATYFLCSVGLYGLSFWLPKILVATGSSAASTGWWAALPFGAGGVAMVFVSRLSRRGLLPAMYVLSALGFISAAVLHGIPAVVAGFSAAGIGIFTALPLFWGTITARMTGKAAGTAIAIVNSVGAIGGFTGPFLMGWLRDKTQSYAVGLLVLAGSMIGAALFAPRSISKRALEVVQPAD